LFWRFNFALSWLGAGPFEPCKVVPTLSRMHVFTSSASSYAEKEFGAYFSFPRTKGQGPGSWFRPRCRAGMSASPRCTSSLVLSSLALARVAIATESGRASLVGVRMHVVGVDEAMMALAHWSYGHARHLHLLTYSLHSRSLSWATYE